MSFALNLPDIDSSVKIAGARVGCLLGIDEHGSPLVDFDGNPFGLIGARLAVPGVDNLTELAAQQASIVLVFENADASRPIIVGVLQSNCSVRSETSTNRTTVLERGSYDVTADSHQLRIEAREELTLRCGKGSLSIRKDGKILLRGTNITSRAAQVNKIKGGAVRIN
jgi:hypothetical protein